MGKFKVTAENMTEALETVTKGQGRGNTRGDKKSVLFVIEPELRTFIDQRVYDLSSPGHMLTVNGYLKYLVEEDRKKYEREQAKKQNKD